MSLTIGPVRVLKTPVARALVKEEEKTFSRDRLLSSLLLKLHHTCQLDHS